MNAELYRRLAAVEALQPDWDGYGADRINPRAAADVKRFLAWLPKDLADPPPFVLPLSAGGVRLEWHGPADRMFELDFHGVTGHGWLKWCPAEGVEEEGTWAVYELANAVAAIRWAMGKDEGEK